MSSDGEAKTPRSQPADGPTSSVFRRLLRVIVALLALSVVLASAALYAWYDLHTPVVPPSGGVVISVPAGASFRAIAVQLHRAGVLRHPRLLTLWARLMGLDRSMRSGEYRIDHPISPVELVSLLQMPSRALHWVTIPEGYTARQVATVLEREGFGGRDVFTCVMHDPALLSALDLPATGVEGFLFPDTYAFSWSSEPEAIIRAMVERYRQHAQPLASRCVAAGLSETDMVTLASVIEKETGKADERPLVSAVFHNRLRLRMPLQSDPTVIYGLDEFDGRLSRADLLHPSPYNTYVHPGLPAGPIANPGQASLEAACAPARTDALYFVARNDGSHAFSATLDEHNRAVRQYQRNR